MKRLGLLLMACVLLLGMSQCKKTENIEPNGNGVKITLVLDQAPNSRVNVDPTGNNGEFPYAPVSFETGDHIYVGYNNAYVGELEYNANGTFTGTVSIYEVVGSQPLHFYMLGGKGYTPVHNGNTITVDISDQGVIDVAEGVHRYPIISYAASEENFPSTSNTYSARLMNKCAMMKFNVSKPEGYDQAGTCIMGMNNRVTVNFNPTSNDNDGFSYDQVNDGAITIDSKIGTVWAIVLPQGALAEGGDMSAFSGRRKGIRPALPEIHANDFITTAYNLNLNTEFAPAGVVGNSATALYKVSDNKYVLFSKANLKATTTDSWSTWTWSFKDTQYEKEIEGDVGNDYSNRTTVSLFGWASSGYYGSIHPNTTYASSQGAFGPQANLTGSNAKLDWGYNKITNSAYKQWRCLTAAEWEYLAENNPHKDSKIITATGNIAGVVILPFGHSADEIHSYSDGYTVAEWETAETTLGAIFMPNAGHRNIGTASPPCNTITSSTSSEMWTSTFDHGSTLHYAYMAEFDYYGKLKINSISRASGFFVRLVCE